MNSPHFKESSHTYILRDTCPLCGRQATEGFTLAHPFIPIPIVKCPTCEMIFSARRLQDSAYIAYYADRFGSERHRKGQQINALVNARWFDRILRDVCAATQQPCALDVGSGYGYFLAYLHKMGIAAEGVEVSHQEAEFAQRQLGCITHIGTLETAALKHKKYNLITAFEVIERILEPIPFLSILKNLLMDEGILIIVTDNFEADCVKVLNAEFPKWIPHTHVTHFGPRTLINAILKAGMDVVDLTSFTPWELMLRTVLKRLLRLKSKGSEDSFNLEATLESEMKREYRLFLLRRVLNPLWAGLIVRGNGCGALMGIVAKKKIGAVKK